MQQRIITAIIALIILVPIIIYGGLPFIIFTYILATIGLYELMRMYTKNKTVLYICVSLPFMWVIIIQGNESFLGLKELDVYNIFVVFIIVLLVLTVLTKNTFSFEQASFVFFATLYISIAFSFLLTMRIAGLNYFLFILFIVWATDSGAYFVGKSLGKRKLWPAISPNKTVGGAIGGIFLALIVGVVFHLVYPFDYSIGYIIMISFIISIVGQMGDLVASAIKRHFDIKDFGKIFPGHGGVLDRVDSLLFVFIVLHLIQFA